MAAVVGDAVAGAVAGEHHIASVHDSSCAVVGNFSISFQNVVNLGIFYMWMLLDPASGRQGDDIEHGGALQHFRRREDDALANPALDVALVLYDFGPNVLFVFDHCGIIWWLLSSIESTQNGDNPNSKKSSAKIGKYIIRGSRVSQGNNPRRSL